MINFAPILLLLIVSIGIVPPKHFFWIIFAALVGYLLIALFYEKILPKLAKRIPPLLPLILYSVFVSSLLIYGYFRVDPSTFPNDPKDYHSLAQTIVKYGIYGRETTIDNKTVIYSTAYRPVGYPLFLAVIYFITRSFNYKFVILLQFIFNLVSIYLFWKIVKNFYSGKIANVATIIYSFNLPLLFVSNILLSETLTQFIILVILYFLVLNFSTKKPVLYGILTGLLSSYLVLIRSNYILYIPIIFIFLYLKISKKSAIIFSLIAIIIFGIWGARNYRQSGKFIITSTNSGINIFLGNHPYVLNGRGTNWPPKEDLKKIIGNAEDSSDYPRLQTGEVFDGIKKEVLYDSIFKKSALNWAVSNPATFTKLVFSRLSYLFIPHRNLFANLEYLNNPYRYQYYFLLTIQSLYFWVFLFLSLVGIFDKRFKLLIFLSIPYLIPILISFSDTRFQLPLYIPMAILAAFGVKRLYYFKKNIKWILLALIIFFAHFGIFRNDFYCLFRYMVFYAKTAYAETHTPEIFIKKIYAEDKYLSAKLVNKYNGVTLDPDIASDSEGVGDDLLIYKNNTLFGLPAYEIRKLKDQDFNAVANLATKLMSPVSNRNTLVLTYRFNNDFKYLRILFTLYRHSSIEIIGKTGIKITSFPVEGDYIRDSLLIPRDFFGSDIEIYLDCEEFPLDSSKIPMSEIYNKLWNSNLANIESIDLVN